MKSFLLKISMALLVAGIVTACGGGAILASLGIGGSGFVSSGAIVAFGSVYVNGVKFETDTAVFEVEDNTSASQNDLRIGMVVQVEGTINPDGITGTATGIRYDDQLEGPITSPVTNPDGTEKSFSVMGTNVIVSSGNTIYEGTSFGFDTLALNNVVEISGYFDENDVLRATYVELKAATFNPSATMEIEGVIANLSGTSFTVRNVNVDASFASISDLDNGLQNGVFVEVKGTYDVASNTITASEIEGEEVTYKDDGSTVSIEGYITRYVSNSDFDIDGYPVNATGAIFEPTTLVLKLGIKVEAEGTVSNGILFADEVETGEGDAEIHATINTIDVNTNSFTMDVVAGGSVITVTVNNETTFEDDVSGLEPFNITHLGTSDFVEVIGFETGATAVTATKVKRRAADDFILQGYATEATGSAAGGGTVTVLGETFDFTTGTDFEDENDVAMTDPQITTLLSTINSTPTLIKVKDTVTADGVADEIDVED